MTQSSGTIIEATRAWILMEFLPGESPDTLDASTPLITSGILDSIGTVRLVSFLEEQFGVQLDAHEISVDHLNTLTQIEQLVFSKRD